MATGAGMTLEEAWEAVQTTRAEVAARMPIECRGCREPVSREPHKLETAGSIPAPATTSTECRAQDGTA